MSEQAYQAARERVIRETAAELNMDVDELRQQVDDILGSPTVLVQVVSKPPTPWETIRKTPKPPKGLNWQQQLQFYRDNAHEVWVAHNGWKHYVLKSYQQDRNQPYARAFCLVDGYESELGDAYWRDITTHAQRVR